MQCQRFPRSSSATDWRNSGPQNTVDREQSERYTRDLQALFDSTQVARTFEATPHRGGSPQVRLASGGSHGHSDVMDATSLRVPTAATHTPFIAALQQLTRLAISCANLLPVSLPPKETGVPTTAAALLARAFAAFPLVTIGVTNTNAHSPQRCR